MNKKDMKRFYGTLDGLLKERGTSAYEFFLLDHNYIHLGEVMLDSKKETIDGS